MNAPDNKLATSAALFAPSVPAVLALADGTIFRGRAIGAAGVAVGEVVFNTSMTGYQEILTDPSYAGQIVTLTYPHVGNVGVNDEDVESNQIHAAGLVIRDLPRLASSWRHQHDLADYLRQANIVGIADLDTRMLTRVLRTKGAQNGCIVAAAGLDDRAVADAVSRARAVPSMAGLDLAKVVSCTKPYEWTSSTWALGSGYAPMGEARFHVVAYDYGIKHNIMRMHAARGCRITVVPAQTPAREVLAMKPDGVFLSNGPGDPEPCGLRDRGDPRDRRDRHADVRHLPRPSIARARGGSAHAQDEIRPSRREPSRARQGHGASADHQPEPRVRGGSGVAAGNCRVTHVSLFDGTLQGFTYTDKPAFCFQGHPEASPGPHDVGYLFEPLREADGTQVMPKRTDIESILIIGAGPIIIGQACEFDYSGAQACKALREEGYRVILVNSNPATIMTDPEMADVTYIEPITWQMVATIIERERPDALLPTMGGQTALNCALDLAREGVLTKFDVELIGATKKAIDKAEDREKFKAAMTRIGLGSARSGIAHNLEQALDVQATIGFPAVLRPSFTLGGTGGGIAYNKEEFVDMVKRGLDLSPTREMLIEESLLGWKEFEMEVVRDKKDNCIIVCSIENLDPMGVHTGDSITVAPAQTLTDKEYQIMRDASIAVLREVGVDTGGSNVQFAINPQDGRMVVIEMNPRVSRSSALASKATGFPIAKVAAKLAVGYTLDELKNDITGGATPASFEPTIDYVVTKVPRFAFEKFKQADDRSRRR
jgi:carbamoylphosphate synthase large subunit/carbamoylphosphate synthase small subunit